MARLSWRGVDAQGRRLSGTCHADSAAAVRHALAARGIAVLRVRRELRLPRRRRARVAERAAALRRLAAVLDAGAPLDAALRTVSAREPRIELRDGLRALRRAVERGSDLAPAFQDALPGLQPAHTALLEAGTWTGDLPGALRSVAEELERRDTMRRQLRRAMAYPAVVAGTALAVLSLLLLGVVPRFEAIFAQSGQPLPAATRLIIAASDAFALVAPLLVGAAAVAAATLGPLLRRRPAWRLRATAALTRLPGIGPSLREAALSRWCETLSRLLGAGVSLLDALPRAAEAARGAALGPALERLERRVSAGEPLAAATRTGLPEAPDAAHLIAVGESAGRLEEMLAEAASLYRQRLETRLERLSAFLEPALIVVLGILTAGVVGALYLPVFEMGGTL